VHQCCPFAPASQPIGNISKEALVYNLLKELDPYHGAFLTNADLIIEKSYVGTLRSVVLYH
jgi:hypothetical protein